MFCLLHKMDLVDASRRKSVYAARVNELRRKSENIAITPFATSIWDETLYRVSAPSPRFDRISGGIVDPSTIPQTRPGLGSSIL